MVNGVLRYAEFIAAIFFEEEHVACSYCPMMTETPRYQCRVSGEYLVDPKHGRGNWCLLIPHNEEEEDQHNGV